MKNEMEYPDILDMVPADVTDVAAYFASFDQPAAQAA